MGTNMYRASVGLLLRQLIGKKTQLTFNGCYFGGNLCSKGCKATCENGWDALCMLKSYVVAVKSAKELFCILLEKYYINKNTGTIATSYIRPFSTCSVICSKRSSETKLLCTNTRKSELLYHRYSQMVVCDITVDCN